MLLRLLGPSEVLRPAAPATIPQTSLQSQVAPLNILLAEDNAINQALGMKLLRKRGHKVVVAENGNEVLEALGKDTFDLILMDIQMPEMDGLEATKSIRRAELVSGKHLHIVAMTANAMAGDREVCMEAGMDGYLTKPLSVRELYSTIQSVGASLARSSESITVNS